MRLGTVVVLAALLSGCGKAQPTTAGGKPVGYWVEALHDRDARLRKKAAFKLGNVGSADAAAFPALLGALQDTDAGVRCEAILALVKFGAAAREAIPALAAATKDRDAKVRAYAAKAVTAIEGNP